MNKSLAIVIPAYKGKFLDQTLESILNQTSRDFVLYIGDDNSPEDLYSIVKKYENKIPLVYHKFTSNLGGVSLVEHWNRCVALTQNEDWIWLFSDDDLMVENCVASFFETLQSTGGQYDVYRFQNTVIDENNKPVSVRSKHPKWETSLEFINRRLSYQTNNFMADYIFSRSVFTQNNGFVNFESAWASDDATWVLFGSDKGIFLIDHAEIYWRSSTINLSGNRSDKESRKKKLKGAGQFVFWLLSEKESRIRFTDSDKLQLWYFQQIMDMRYKNFMVTYLKSPVFGKMLYKKPLGQIRVLGKLAGHLFKMVFSQFKRRKPGL